MNPYGEPIFCEGCLDKLRAQLPAAIRHQMLRAFSKGATRTECADIFHRVGAPPWMLLAIVDWWDQLEANRLSGT